MADYGGLASAQVYLQNEATFLASLERAKQITSDLRVPLTLITKDFYKSQKTIFMLQGAGQYKDLSTNPLFPFWERGPLRRLFPGGYKEYKEAKYGFVYPILKATGALEKATTDPKAEGAVNQIINKDTLILGVKLMSRGANYPWYLQHGTAKMPARPFFFIGPESSFATDQMQGRPGRWKNILNEYVLKCMGAPGSPPASPSTIPG